MNTLLHGLMNNAQLLVADTEPDYAAQEEFAKNFRPNRAQRRAQARIHLGQRWDKKLAGLYGIPKAFRQHANRYGSSTEMMLSEMLQQGVIEYKEMPHGDALSNSLGS